MLSILWLLLVLQCLVIWWALFRRPKDRAAWIHAPTSNGFYCGARVLLGRDSRVGQPASRGTVEHYVYGGGDAECYRRAIEWAESQGFPPDRIFVYYRDPRPFSCASGYLPADWYEVVVGLLAAY